MAKAKDWNQIRMPTPTVLIRNLHGANFHDVENEVGKNVERTMYLVDFSNILCAGDTFIAGKGSRELNKNLHAIAKTLGQIRNEAQQRNMLPLQQEQ